LRVKKNLGSRIVSVGDMSSAGYTVQYDNGDLCGNDNTTRYSSEIKYICNEMSDELGWPDFVGVTGSNKCHYKF
jgi:hypothetical protein